MTKNWKITALLLCLALLGVVAMPYMRQQMFSLSDEVVAQTIASLRAKGCDDQGKLAIKSSTVGFDPVGPGPFKASPSPAQVQRFKCPDGTVTDVPVR